MPLNRFNATEIQAEISSVRSFLLQIYRAHENFADEEIQNKEQVVLNIQGAVAVFLEELEARGYSKTRINFVKAAVPTAFDAQNIFADGEYFSRLREFLSNYITELNRDLSLKQIETASTVPDTLPELVQNLQNSQIQAVEVSRWQKILESQLKEYNRGLYLRLLSEAEADLNIQSPGIKNPVTQEYLVQKVTEVTTAIEYRNTDIRPVYNEVISRIKRDAASGEISAQTNTAKEALIILGMASSPIGLGTPSQITDYEKTFVQNEIRTTIALVKRAAQELRPTGTRGAVEAATIKSLVVAPMLISATRDDGKAAQEITQERKKIADLSQLPGEDRKKIANEINTFQLGVNRLTEAVRQKVEQGVYIDSGILQMQIMEEQIKLDNRLRKQVGHSLNDMPTFIKGTVAYSFDSIQIPQLTKKEITQIIRDSQQWHEQSLSKLAIINELQKNTTLEDLMTDDVLRLRQNRYRSVVEKNEKNPVFIEAIIKGLSPEEFEHLRRYHPYLSEEIIARLIHSGAAIPGWQNIDPEKGAALLLLSMTATGLAAARSETQRGTTTSLPGQRVDTTTVKRPVGGPSTPSVGQFAGQLGPTPSFFGPPPDVGQPNSPSRMRAPSQSGLPGLPQLPFSLPAKTAISLFTKPWVWIMMFVIVIFLGFLITTLASPIGSTLPSGNQTQGASSNDTIAKGTCPIANEPRVLVGTYRSGGSGHGTDAYWNSVISRGLAQSKYEYPMPDSEMISSCYEPGKCEYYGLSLDVVSRAETLPKVTIPVVCPNGGNCDASRSWKVVSRRGNRPELFLETTDGSPKWKIYLLHIEPLVNVGDVVITGQVVGQVMPQTAATPHLHFEIDMDGRPVDPTPFCTGGGAGGLPAPLPPNLGQCKEEVIAKYFDKDEVANAMCVCQKESGGDASIQNRGCFVHKTDEHSIGLFQINLLVHDPPALNCPGGYNWGGVGSKMCTVKDEKIVSACVGYLSNPENNIKYAAKLQREQGWRPWSTRFKCGL